MTQTTSIKIDSNADVAFTDTKQKVTGIKDVEDLEVRIEKLEEIFSYLRNKKLKQKEVILGTDDETSSNDDTSSNDEISSSEDLINYLSARDVEWQLPKNTQEEPPKPHYAPIKTEVEEPLPLDIVYPHSHVASSVMGTNRTGKAHYGLRSLGPLKEEMVHVKKPYNMVRVTNTVLGLKASNSGFGYEFPTDDEMFLEIYEVVFKIHTKEYFEFVLYRRAMVNGKAKMVEDVGAVKRGKDRGVVIEDGGFINDGGKETVVTKRAIGSRKMEGKSVMKLCG
ncbi:hypothetical protein Tco_0365953 [Tanacetum coccineum]